MYPFSSRLRWTLAGPTRHLLRILEAHPQAATDPILVRRVVQLERWGRIRLGFAVLVQFSLLGTAASVVGQFLRLPPATETLVDWLTAVVGAFAGASAVGLLLAMRTCRQFEMDIFGQLAILNANR